MKKEVTCAVMYVTPYNVVLLIHPHKAPWNCWSLPKGLCEVDESPNVAAARELQEETGLLVDPSNLIDLGRYPYIPAKDYHLFFYRSPIQPSLTELICESTFLGRDGTQIKEVDKFIFTSIENALKILNKKQAAIVDNQLLYAEYGVV